MVRPSWLNSTLCAAPPAPEATCIGTFQRALAVSLPLSRKRFWLSAIVRSPAASHEARTLISGKPGCVVQLPAIAPTSLPLAALSAFHRSAAVALENLRAAM